MDDTLAGRVADSASVVVTGLWQRHCAARRRDTILDGRQAYGRWGQPDGFPVLYLGRPTDSVVVEAYRHLIDPIEDASERAALARNLAPRVLVTVEVSVAQILDLREVDNQEHLDLTGEILSCATDDRNGYAACQSVATAAHENGLRGLIAPAATGLGETLVLFSDILPEDQRPIVVGPDELWIGLPTDPRL